MEIKMNIVSKTLALSLVSVMAFAGISHAESRSGNFTVQMIDQLDDGNMKTTLKNLQPNDVSAAQSELSADASLAHGVTARGISPSNVIKIDTALDGSKIVYVR
jgi:hypothetical protein